MPAVCRFYLKGYCRYGSNCRFEHPGEGNTGGQASSGGGGGFSFTRALEESRNPTSSGTDFSFTRALQSPGPVSSSFSSTFQQQPSSPFGLNQSNYLPYFNQQQQSTSLASGFSFTGALEKSIPLFGNQSQSSFFGNPRLGQQLYQQPGTLFNSTATFNTTITSQSQFGSLGQNAQEVDMRFGINADSPKDQNIQLTETELSAYRADKFQFRLIPVRPPPESLCR